MTRRRLLPSGTLSRMTRALRDRSNQITAAAAVLALGGTIVGACARIEGRIAILEHKTERILAHRIDDRQEDRQARQKIRNELAVVRGAAHSTRRMLSSIDKRLHVLEMQRKGAQSSVLSEIAYTPWDD